MTELHYASLGDVCARIKSGETTSVQVTETLLERIGRLEGELHAYAMVLADEALETAARLDKARADGQPLGLLHGVPVALKDLLFTKGLATASGTRVMADFIPDEDATVVARLREAGAVVIGKTQLTEGAYGVHHPDIEAPKNPWDPERWPGVSSSGSAVAVAAGLAYGALGSDTGGSIRFPSASCGIVGLKPTYGRVSRHGAFPLAESLDHIGPMTRTVADAARMLQAIAGVDPRDPTSLNEPVPNYGAALAERLAGLKVGVDWDYVERGVETVVADTIRDALAALKSLGAEVIEIVMPESYQTLVAQWGITCGVECASAHRNYYPAQKSLYGPVLADLIELGLHPPEGVYAALERTRGVFAEALNKLFDKVELLISPCMPYLPPGTEGIMELANDPERANGLTFTAPFDYSGHPTLSLPAGLSRERLPKSFQLIGPWLGEPVLIGAGSAFETATGFREHPIP
ncbi:MAG: amidase [Pseudomonadales bacterium]